MRTRMSAVVVALLVLTGVASAQETSGTLSGRLVDTQGLAVPGVTVTVTGRQGAKTFVSDSEGRFNAPFLTPGTYDVRAELQGFKAVDTKGVNVSIGQSAELMIRMEVGGMTETVNVVSSAVTIDTGSTTTGAVISSELLASVPVGRRLSDAVYLAPGVSSGGSVGRANPSVSGGSGLDNVYIVDGVNVTNTGYGALGSYSLVFGSLGNATPYDFIQEVQVKTGGYQAEFGQSLGGVINVVTKSGTNSLRGSVFGYAQPKSLEGEWKTFQSVNGTVNTVATERLDGGVEAGGRIVRDRVFFFGAINPGLDRRTFIAPDGFPLQRLGEVERERTSLSYSTKATVQLNSQNRIDASFFGDPSKGKSGLQRTSALLVNDTSSFSELNKYGGHNQNVKYEGAISSNFLLEGSWARALNEIEETPSVNEWRVTDQTASPQRISGGIGFYEAGNRSLNLQYAGKATFLFGGHQFKAGGLYEDVEYSQINQRTGPTFLAPDGRRTATGAQVTILNDVNFGRIFRVTRANFNSSRLTTQNYKSFFLQDQWRAASRLTINAGLRYEEQTLVGTFAELTTLTGETLNDFPLKNNWGPRVGVVYDVLGSGRSKLFANYGRYFARIPNDLAARALSADDGVSASIISMLG
ncbi:MAG TPA: TonB-dependent receptor [Vicinamibacterales bacterium]|nr:TonB-dependent receptor [Vicinamibacterales bacterium]